MTMASIVRLALSLTIFFCLGASSTAVAQDFAKLELRYFLNSPYYGTPGFSDSYKLAHFNPLFHMTTSGDEINAIALRTGWGTTQDEGVAATYPGYFGFSDAAAQSNFMGYVYGQQVAGTVPLYRYMKPASGDHFFTTDGAEGQRAVTIYNYVSEGVCCYIPLQPLAGTTPLYRLLKGGRHFYTTSSHLRDVLTIKEGYKQEGDNAGYVWTAP